MTLCITALFTYELGMYPEQRAQPSSLIHGAFFTVGLWTIRLLKNLKAK
jgi:hypothetical protein